MTFVETSAGPIEVIEREGAGRTIVFVGGLAMDATVWNAVTALLPEFRTVAITLPLGSHRRPMRPDADLSLAGLARIEAEVLQELDIHDAVLVGNDSGAFLGAAVAEQERLAGLVITTCEAFERFPPGLPGRSLAAAARVPGALALLIQTLRIPAMRGTRTAFGWMSRNPIPTTITDRWLTPLLTDPEVRRDLAKYLRSATGSEMLSASEALISFTRPSMVLWTPEDRVMDPTHGRRIASLLPNASYHEIQDSYTLIQLDQPAQLAAAIREFEQAL